MVVTGVFSFVGCGGCKRKKGSRGGMRLALLPSTRKAIYESAEEME